MAVMLIGDLVARRLAAATKGWSEEQRATLDRALRAARAARGGGALAS